jgi:hypothetical protein
VEVKVLWLFFDLGIIGIVVFFLTLLFMPILALVIAIREREPVWLLLILTWIITFGSTNDWIQNPFENSALWIVGLVIGIVSWIATIGGAYMFAKILTGRNS